LPRKDLLIKVSKALSELSAGKESLKNNDDCGRCGRSFSSSRGLQLHQARCSHIDKSERNGYDDDEDGDDEYDEYGEKNVINDNKVKRPCSYKECIHCGKWDHWTRIARCCLTKNQSMTSEDRDGDNDNDEEPGLKGNNSSDINASVIPGHAYGTRGKARSTSFSTSSSTIFNASVIPGHAYGTRRNKNTTSSSSSSPNRFGTQISLPKGLGTHIPDPEGGGYWNRCGGPVLAGYGPTKDVKRKPAIIKATSCKSKKRKSGREETSSESKTKKREYCIQYVPPLVILRGKKPTPSNLYYSLNNEDDDNANDDGSENLQMDDDGHESWTDGNYCWLPPHGGNPKNNTMSERSENLQMRKPKSSKNISKTSLQVNKEEDSSKRRRLSVNAQSRIINPYLKAQQEARDHMLANGEAWNKKEEIVMI